MKRLQLIDIEKTNTSSSPRTFHEFLQETMKKILNLKPLTTKTALATFYSECHPCTTTIFHSSNDFLQRISSVLDYGLKILPVLVQFELLSTTKIKDVYIFQGFNKTTYENESWCFLSKKAKSDSELLEHINLFFDSDRSHHTMRLWMYCLEDGDTDCLQNTAQAPCSST
ncbi:hypothetical protein [Salipaludibacillus sp. CF4.18]|uniref:hypothetical protein n=1 Tax=Salipaludibacillus sp. CF4.18 TaxID=3373081 RepID=UPI003EE74080